MIRVFGTVLATVAGLAFGSFLNVCLTRWPAGESVVTPRSHCRSCGRTLTWWENIPLLSWMMLGGRCRSCLARIGSRYPAVELTIGLLWGLVAWQASAPTLAEQFLFANLVSWAVQVVGRLVFCWLLVALAVLDAESLWLPNWLTVPGIALGFLVNFVRMATLVDGFTMRRSLLTGVGLMILGSLAAAALVLMIRRIYWMARRREGIGLGDAVLMAMLGAWLGLAGALLAFAIGVVLGALVALVILALPGARRGAESWAFTKLPLGTFLCVGGIVSGLWGEKILSAYLRWSGLG
jgi:leader peptidase (prepilin peptidase) / N-methyltransferase